MLGITVPERDGGAGMDAVAACIVHHELSKYSFFPEMVLVAYLRLDMIQGLLWRT